MPTLDDLAKYRDNPFATPNPLAPQTSADPAPPASPALPTPPASPAPPLLGQQVADYESQQQGTALGDMAMTGVAGGVGAGVLMNLLSSWKERQIGKKKPRNMTRPVTIPFATKQAENPITDGMSTDPFHGVKLVGALGAPLVGSYLLTRGVGNWRKKQRQKDEAEAVKQDYQKALGEYSAAASGLKLASERSELDLLAMTKTADPNLFNGFGLAGQGNPIADAAITGLNVTVPLAAAYGGLRFLQGMKKKKKVLDEARKVEDQAVSDWRRKELFYRPPPIIATPEMLPTKA